MFGLIVLDKPLRMSSRQAMDYVKRLARPAKVGHAGTLDPLATGVLVVCLGPATRLVDRVQAQRKHYTATFLLGRHSPSEDLESEVTLLVDPPRPTLDELRQAAARLTGEIQQRPPAFSALKIDGQRAYDLARKGREVELATRPVTIHSLEVTRYDYPEATLDIVCGGGTYVRSLGRDLGLSLGSAAVMSALVRTAIGPFDLASAVDPRELTAENLAAHLQPALRAVANLPRVEVSAAECARLANGMTIVNRGRIVAEEIAAVDLQGELVALLAPRGENLLGPTMNFRVGG